MVIGWMCSRREFRDSMVATYMDTAVGWANEYSPILDVTAKVASVMKDVKRAFLTIYGDKLDKIIILGPQTEMPGPLPDAEIVFNWLLGFEWERQTCSRDGYVYWVGYPAHLRVELTTGEVIETGAEPSALEKYLPVLALGGAVLGTALVLRGREKVPYEYIKERTRW